MDAVLSFTSMQTYQIMTEIACSRFPGAAESTSDKVLSGDTITMREEKPTSIGFYVVQVKDRKPGFGNFQLSFPS